MGAVIKSSSVVVNEGGGESEIFIVKIIHFLDFNFGIRFFITPMDFDVLHRWWEKRIPLRLIEESIEKVVHRRRERNRRILGFNNFYHEVRKNYQRFMEMSVGDNGRQEERDGTDKIDRFFQNFPPPLESLRNDFSEFVRKALNKETVDINPIYDALLALFDGDNELNVKVRLFMQNLAPTLRTPKIERRYRLNYLLNRFHIPDFENILSEEDED